MGAALKPVWVALGFAIGGVVICLSLRPLDWPAVQAAFAQAHLGWLLLGFAAVLALSQTVADCPLAGSMTAIAGPGALLSVLTAVLTVPKALGRLVLRMLKKPFGRLVPQGLTRFGLRTLIHISHIVRGQGSLRLIGLSVLGWTIEGGVIYSAVQALGLTSALAGPWLAIVSGNLGTLLPGTPGHFGT